MSRVHQTGPGAQCYLADLADMAVQALVHSANLGRMQEGMHTKFVDARAVADKQVC